MAFQIFVSKRYVVADQNDLRSLISRSTMVEASQTTTPLQGAMNVQDQVVQTIENSKDSVVSIVVTKNLQFYLQDPRGFR